MLDGHYKLIPAAMTVDEMTSIFDEMTSELFKHRPDLRDSGAMMVHLFPNLNETHVDPTYQDGLPGKPHNHSSFKQLSVTKYDFGILTLCRQDFHRFGTHYQWHHFVHNDALSWGNRIRDRLISSGLHPAHEWWISYMCTDHHFQKHVDGIAPLLRYSFVIKQPMVDASIEIDDTMLFFPEGTAYIMDGEVPHQVINRSKESRMLLLGSVLPISLV